MTEGRMNQIIDPLVLDLVEWVAKAPRPYAEVIDAWRTSCPRLTVWEEAVDRKLVMRTTLEGDGAKVAITASGLRLLREHGRMPVSS
jgi:hypothetical protein